MTTPKAARKNARRNLKKTDKSAAGPAANLAGGGGVPTRPRKPT